MGIVSKIKKRQADIKKAYKAEKVFSAKFARCNRRGRIAGMLRIKSVAENSRKKKDDFIVNYLEDTYRSVINKYAADTTLGEKCEDSPIWVCWWTGEETAPPLVKQCIKSTRKNAGKHPVCIVTKDNYCNYLDIPDYIMEKVNDGRMCVANFSDYLRFSLLAKYGGLWIDATIFCSRPIPKDYFDKSVFTCKYFSPDSNCISKSRWTTFCTGGWKGNVYFKFMQEAFECYWQKHDTAIDYLLVDYTIYTAYSHIPAFREIIDTLANNNSHRNDLAQAMVSGKPAEMFDLVINDDTVFYKLSWREKYPLTTADGKKSIFAYYLEKEI